jgi:hypothetical protein
MADIAGRQGLAVPNRQGGELSVLDRYRRMSRHDPAPATKKDGRGARRHGKPMDRTPWGSTLVIYDFRGGHGVSSDFEMAVVLGKRNDNGFNEFWLQHADAKHPSNQDLACVHYFPEDGHPGLQSVRLASDLDPDGTTAFRCTEWTTRLNSTVIPFSWALDVAKEFAGSKWLPRRIEWFEL